MKNLTILFLALINSYFGSTQTNIYHPLPQGWGATWHSEHIVGGTIGPIYTYKTTMWGGDTVINSLTYTKVYNKVGPNLNFVGGVRQDVALEKAYFFSTIANTETDISFNQHVQIGDTTNTTLVPYWGADTTFVVTDIDSISVLGSYRKRIHLEALDVNQSQTIWGTYVAGVGFISYSGWEWSWNVDCFLIENNIVIGTPQNPACVLSTPKSDENLTFTIFPNPNNGLVKLNKSPERVLIFSSDGKEVASELYSLIGNNLDVSKLENGVYFGQFIFKYGSIKKSIVKL